MQRRYGAGVGRGQPIARRAGSDVPEPNVAVLTTGGADPAVGTPGNAGNRAVVAAEELAYLAGLVEREEAWFAIGRPG